MKIRYQCTVSGNTDWCNHSGKQYGISSKKLTTELPFDSVIPLLGIYLKNPETLIQKNLFTPMFIAALFTIPKCWKQSKCPSEDEWIKKLCYIYTMDYYAAERKNSYLL